MRYHVIDCTKASGTTYTTRFHAIALVVARWATLFTGRFHDVVPDADGDNIVARTTWR